MKKCIEKIIIETVDNPGWWVEFHLTTSISDEEIRVVNINNSKTDWMFIITNKKQIKASSDLLKLVKIFDEIGIMDTNFIELYNLLEWLCYWYLNECDGFWEHLYGIKVIIEKENFRLAIDLNETYWENKPFPKIEKMEYFCQKNSKFEAEGNILFLKECLERFRCFIEKTR